VISPEDRPEQELPGSRGWVRLMIDAHVGATNLLQRVFRYRPGRTPQLDNDSSEDVMFVVEGLGTVDLGTASFELAPGTGVFVPPGVAYAIENPGPHDLVLVSVLSPPPGHPEPAHPEEPVTRTPTYTVREEDQPVLAAGEDRSFRLLIDPRRGCRNVTQFVGYIEGSGARPHRHRYEEAVAILDGEGVVEIDGDQHHVARGWSVFLPPGIPHRISGSGLEALRLLGVFSPAGSPAAREDLPR